MSVCAGRVDEIAQHSPIGELIAARNDHLGANRKGQQQLEDRDVEAQRRDGEHTIVSAMPGTIAMLRRKFATAACKTSTPFGLPVDPDV